MSFDANYIHAINVARGGDLIFFVKELIVYLKLY